MKHRFNQLTTSVLLLFGLVTSLGIPVSALAADKPNIVVIWGDDIVESNISALSFGLMGYQTPNIGQVGDAVSL
jgi:arylsulfatase